MFLWYLSIGANQTFFSFFKLFSCFVLSSFDNNSILYILPFVNSFFENKYAEFDKWLYFGKKSTKNFLWRSFYQHMLIFLCKINNKGSLLYYNTLLNIKEKTRSFDLWISSYEPITRRAVKCIYFVTVQTFTFCIVCLWLFIAVYSLLNKNIRYFLNIFQIEFDWMYNNCCLSISIYWISILLLIQ